MDEELLVKKFGEHHAEVKGLLDNLVNEQKDARERLKHIELAQSRMGGGSDFVTKTIGQRVVESPELDALRKRGKGTERIKLEGVSLSTKATILSSNIGGGVVAPDIAAPAVLPQRRLTVRDLLSAGTTTSSSIKFARMTSRSNSAGNVSEGAAKPEQNLEFEIDTAEVEVIAAWVPASRQILDDAGQLQALIDNELRFAVKYREEAQLLFGDGTSPNLRGLIPGATAFSAPFAVSAEQMLDKVLQAKAQLESQEYEPDGIILNSLDWSRMLALKDSTGRYLYEGGPFSGGPGTLWQLPVVPTNAMSQDKFACGAFKRAGTVFDRQEVVVEVSTEHSDFFTHNKVAILAEERVALALGRPDAVVHGDFGLVT